MYPPDDEHVGRAAAPDVDQVLRQKVAAQVLDLAREERQVGDHAAPPGEGAVGQHQAALAVAARRVEEADPGPVAPGQADEVIEQQRVVRVLRDPAATDRYDLPPRHRRPPIRAPAIITAAVRCRPVQWPNEVEHRTTRLGMSSAVAATVRPR